MGSRVEVSERDRRLWGEDWARSAEIDLRERVVRFDPALSTELGKRALLYLSVEYAIPRMTVWAHLQGRSVLEQGVEELVEVA